MALIAPFSIFLPINRLFFGFDLTAAAFFLGFNFNELKNIPQHQNTCPKVIFAAS